MTNSIAIQSQDTLLQQSCCRSYQRHVLTTIALAAIGLVIAGGVIYHLAALKQVIAFTLIGIGSGGVIAVSITTALLCLRSTPIKQQKNKSPEAETGVSSTVEQKDVESQLANPLSIDTDEELPTEIRERLEYLFNHDNEAVDLPEPYEAVIRYCLDHGAPSVYHSRTLFKAICDHPQFVHLPIAWELVARKRCLQCPMEELTFHSLVYHLIRCNGFNCPVIHILLKKRELDFKQLANMLFSEKKGNQFASLKTLLFISDQYVYDKLFENAILECEVDCEAVNLFMMCERLFTSTVAKQWLCTQHNGLIEQEEEEKFIEEIVTAVCLREVEDQNQYLQVILENYFEGIQSSGEYQKCDPFFSRFFSFNETQRNRLIILLGTSKCLIPTLLFHHFLTKDGYQELIYHDRVPQADEIEILNWALKPSNQKMLDNSRMYDWLRSIKEGLLNGLLLTLDADVLPRLIQRLCDKIFFKADRMVIDLIENREQTLFTSSLSVALLATLDTVRSEACLKRVYTWFVTKCVDQEAFLNHQNDLFKNQFVSQMCWTHILKLQNGQEVIREEIQALQILLNHAPIKHESVHPLFRLSSKKLSCLIGALQEEKKQAILSCMAEREQQELASFYNPYRRYDDWLYIPLLSNFMNPEFQKCPEIKRTGAMQLWIHCFREALESIYLHPTSSEKDIQLANAVMKKYQSQIFSEGCGGCYLAKYEEHIPYFEHLSFMFSQLTETEQIGLMASYVHFINRILFLAAIDQSKDIENITTILSLLHRLVEKYPQLAMHQGRSRQAFELFLSYIERIGSDAAVTLPDSFQKERDYLLTIFR